MPLILYQTFHFEGTRLRPYPTEDLCWFGTLAFLDAFPFEHYIITLTNPFLKTRDGRKQKSGDFWQSPTMKKYCRAAWHICKGSYSRSQQANQKIYTIFDSLRYTIFHVMIRN